MFICKVASTGKPGIECGNVSIRMLYLFKATGWNLKQDTYQFIELIDHMFTCDRSTPPRIQGPGGKNLQLQFKSRMPPHLFTGGKVEGDQGAAIHVVLIDLNTGSVVQSGPESVAKLNIVVLEGDFNEEDDDDWTKEQFEGYEVKEREGKRPLLTGDLQVTLKEGIGTVGDLTFTDNSSWIRSRKFRLGVKVAPGYCEEIRIREAKTEAFAVKDHRGECEFSNLSFLLIDWPILINIMYWMPK